MDRVRALEEAICNGGVEQANELGELLRLFKQSCKSENTFEDAESSDEEDRDEYKERLSLLHAMRRCFSSLLKRGDLKAPEGEVKGSALAKYQKWLEARYIEFLKITAKWIEHSSAMLQVAGVRTLLYFVQHDSMRFRSPEESFGNGVFRLLIGTALKSAKLGGLTGQVMRVLGEEYLHSYADVRHATLVAVRDFCNAKYNKIQQQEEEEEGERKKNPAESNTDAKWTPQGVEDTPMEIFSTNAFQLLYLTPITEKKALFKEPTSWMVTPIDGQLNGDLAKRASRAERKEFQAAWIALLRLPGMPDQQYRRVLLALPKHILPNFKDPLLLSDFLTDAYDVGGLTAVMALNSLFKLISEHGLDYPDFFGKLYQLIDLSVFHAKHRDQFFSLLDKFLSSAHLASYLVASFAKKILRIALMAPPGSSMFALVLVSNLLKRHPTCISLVHTEDNEPEQVDGEEQDINISKRSKLDEIKAASLRLALGGGEDESTEKSVKRKRSESANEITEDPFDFAQPDPSKSRALESCLWEIEALANHYNPNVSMLAKGLFFTELKATVTTRKVQPMMPMDDFYGITYRSLFDRECKKARKSKTVPLTFKNIYAKDASEREEESSIFAF